MMMPPDLIPLSAPDQPPAGGVPPPLPGAKPKPGGGRKVMALLLNLFVGLFLFDGILSLADDTLILGRGTHLLTLPREILSFLVVLVSIGIYFLMGLTPLIPKRWFLPLTL